MGLREILAQNIRKYRKEQNISQEELARRCGIHRTYMGLIERAKANISIDNIQKIAETLEINPKDLLVLIKQSD